MDLAHVEISDNSIHINHLEVPVKEVADFFRSIPPAEHSFMLMKAIEVGVFCLERGRTAQDTDFVKRKMTELLPEPLHRDAAESMGLRRSSRANGRACDWPGGDVQARCCSPRLHNSRHGRSESWNR